MSNTRMILAEVVGDQDVIYAKIKLAVNPPIAVTDDKAGERLKRQQDISQPTGTGDIIFMQFGGPKGIPKHSP